MKNYLIVFSILILAFFIRFYNFQNRVTFGPEQAISLSTSAQMIKEKVSLLGIENVQRSTSTGLKIFSGVLFSYTLIPLLIIFNYNPIPITYYFAILNIFTGLIIFLVTKKILNTKIAYFSLILFLFNSYMIYHSEFIWILNYLPLVGIGTINFWYKFVKEKKILWIFLLGILSGIGFSLEYIYLFTILLILFLLLIFKNKIKNIFYFLSGVILPNLPLIIFDIKHDFYHLRTVWQYTIDTINGSATAGITYYHFLQYWPLFAMLGGIGFYFIYQKSKLISLFLLTIYILINLNSKLVDIDKPVGMVDGLNILDIKKSAEIISKNTDNNFNVVTLFDFDTRGHVLRYYLDYVYNRKPKNEVEYQSVDSIFAIATSDYDFNNNNPWELNIFKPYNIERLENIGQGYTLFKLTK